MRVIIINFYKKFLPLFLLLVAMSSIQIGASLAKQLFPIVGAQGTSALRLFYAALILLILFRPWKVKLSIRSLQTLFMYGLSLGAMNIFFYMSVQTLPLGIAVSLEFTGPLLLTILASKKFIDFVWILLATFGLVLLFPFGIDSPHTIDGRGAFYALIAGISWAIYIIFAHRAGEDFGVKGVALGTIVASILVVPIGIADAGINNLFNPSIIPLSIAVAIFSTALPYTLEIIALTSLPVRSFGTLMSLEPVFATIAGWLLLSEELNLLQCIAIFSIIISSIGTSLTKQTK